MDPTENIRRQMIAEHIPGSREDLEARYGQVWDTDELTVDFEVIGFLAPFVRVRRKSDRADGSMMFQHRPRFYYNFQPS